MSDNPQDAPDNDDDAGLELAAQESEEPPSGDENPSEGENAGADGAATQDGRVSPRGAEGTSARFSAGSVNAQAIFNAGSLSHLAVQVGGSDRVEQISAEHYDEVDARALDELFGDISLDPRLVERGRSIIAENGVLCVVGRPGCGKATFGLAVAQRLLLADVVDKILLFRPLESQVRVPRELDKRIGGPQRRLLVFEDALAYDNSDLRRFLHDLARGKLSILAARLKRQRTQLLFTLDEASIADSVAELRNSRVVFDMPLPTEEQVREIIRREAVRLRSAQWPEDRLSEGLSSLLDHSGALVYERLRTIPEVVRFCRNNLLSVLEQRVEVEAALDQLEDLTSWFLDKATKEREAWCELLALTLASSSPATATVPWLAHRRLAQALSTRLRRSLAEEESPRQPEELFTSHLERGLLGHAERKPELDGTVLRFDDRTLAERLWSVLLGSGRSISWWLSPLLEKLALDEDPVLARLAARALGRIGELAPESLTYATFRRWAETEPTPVASIAGLFAGALSSRREDYRQGVLELLQRRLRHGSEAETWAACICLPALATTHAERAVDELFVALEERFEPRGDEPSISRHLNSVATSLRNKRRRLSDWTTAELFPQPRHQVFLAGLKYAVIGFCFSSERLEILNRIRTRLEAENGGASMLVAMSFFEPHGVLDTVERFPVFLQQDDDSAWSDAAHSRFLASAMMEDAATDLVRFLQTAWKRLAEVPVPFRHSLRQRLLGQLRRWSKEPPQGEVGETLASILSVLLESPDSELAEQVFDLLRTDIVFLPGAPAAELAERALSLRSRPSSATTG